MSRFLIFLCGILLFISCDKIFLEEEGYDARIQGKWQHVPADTIFYNFQGNLFQYQIYTSKDTIVSVYGNYTLYGDTAIYMELETLYTYKNNRINLGSKLNIPDWDSVAPGKIGRRYGISGPSDGKLKLTYQTKELSFQKF